MTIRNEDWQLTTDYDGQVICEQCDNPRNDLGVLLNAFTEPVSCWSFTITQLLALIEAHRQDCHKDALPLPVKEERETVRCDYNCGAFVDPVTLDEYKDTLGHWESCGCLGGCSHGC